MVYWYTCSNGGVKLLLCHGPPESHDASLLVLDNFENDGVLEQDAEDVEDAHDHPRFHSR